MNQSKALRELSSRRVFAPYFRARWQNMQNIINDSVFYATAPEPYLTYYTAYIRQWKQWASGFVPMLHRGDFFSTGMGYTVCEIFTKECMSGGWHIDSPTSETKQFFERYAERNKYDETFSEMYFEANAGGNAVLVLTPKDGELVTDVLPINRIRFALSDKENICYAELYRRFIAGETSIYAREVRLKTDEGSFYKIELRPSSGTVLSPSWGSAPLKAIPDNVEDLYRHVYGDVEINTWYELPECLHSLGLYNVKNKALAVAISDMPGYSDSTLHTALDVLYSIDFNYTQQQLDQYFGKTRVLMPKRMQNPIDLSRNRVANGLSWEEVEEPSPLDQEIMMEVPNGSVDGKPIQPTWLQPDLRGETHKYIRDADLELLASKVGLSSVTLANHLAYNSPKTAYQVGVEQDATDKSVGEKRRLASSAINAMLADLAAFYELTDDVSIVWNKATSNTAEQNEDLAKEVEAGRIPFREYLKRKYRDLTEEQISEWEAYYENHKQMQSEQAFGNFEGTGF